MKQDVKKVLSKIQKNLEDAERVLEALYERKDIQYKDMEDNLETINSFLLGTVFIDLSYLREKARKNQ